ncbi:MAG: hypothetical protein ACK5U8_10095, partial [Deltaproteobacteria bacterium]
MSHDPSDPKRSTRAHGREAPHGGEFELDAVPPPAIVAAVARVQRRIHGWLLVDAVLSGVGLALATAAPIGLGLHLLDPALEVDGALGFMLALWPAWTLGAVAGLAFGGWQLRSRRLDPVRAARVLDRMLEGKDRFASAIQFAAEAKGAEVPTLHRLQMKEAAEHLASVASVPEPPRPIARAPRWLAGGVFAVAATVPLALVWPELRRAVAESLGQEPEPRTAEEIAQEADALRRSLEEDPERRVDAEINRLEHELDRARTQAAHTRAAAIEEAAQALEGALGIAAPSEDTSGGEPSDGPPSETLPEVRSVDGEPPPYASER